MNRFYIVFVSVVIAVSLAGCGKDAPENAVDNSITVTAWGPKSMVLGQKSNRKNGEEFGIWLKLNTNVQPDELEAWVGGLKMGKISVSDQKAVFSIDRSLLKTPGMLPMHLVHVPSGKSIALGDFEVRPKTEAAPSITITAWGPQSTTVGKGFNVQKSGSSAIWFKMSGADTPRSMEAWFGDKKLEKLSISSNKGGAIQIPQGLLAKKGEFPVYLVHLPSKKRYVIGKFVIK
ncbi:MAG: hypothetical protein HZB95_07110 [Nitrosomonadales bacterium]|nr:hypothetical protein [Nitrosomonadales bacterium]